MKAACSEILAALAPAVSGNDIALPSCVASDSRKLRQSGIFIAVPGTRSDGHDFIPEVMKQAAAIVHSRPLTVRIPENVTCYRVGDTAAAAALLFRAQQGNPDLDLKLLGVTGTNGKTTTAFLLEHLFSDRGCGLLSTVETRDGIRNMPATHTTPDAEHFYALLAEMKKNHLQYAAMELSSHALHQNRVYGAAFQTAIFTNLTGDHLDYHKDMEQYYQAKKRFFTQLLAPDGTAIVNIGDPAGRRLAQELENIRKVITFGTAPDAGWQIQNLQCSCSGSSFEIVSRSCRQRIRTNLTGHFNALNLTGAILAAREHDLDWDSICRKLQTPVCVPGRMQFIHAPCGAAFVIDYAHTDDALKNVLAALRPLVSGRLICVFGAGGDRDQSKRPRMGLAASAADHLIVTSDNPRSEAPEEIIRQIVSGITAGVSCEIEPDRSKAIIRAVESTSAGDVVLIAGKGHENYQEIRGVRHPFSDRLVLEQALERIKS